VLVELLLADAGAGGGGGGSFPPPLTREESDSFPVGVETAILAKAAMAMRTKETSFILHIHTSLLLFVYQLFIGYAIVTHVKRFKLGDSNVVLCGGLGVKY
jgi:hypothetical protein